MIVPFAIDLQEILSATLPPIIEVFYFMILLKYQLEFIIRINLSVFKKLKIEETIFGSHFENKVDRTILKRILTSFFQTHGCAVIIGNDLNLVNMVNISFLILF